jgi:hypothetical protein
MDYEYIAEYFAKKHYSRSVLKRTFLPKCLNFAHSGHTALGRRVGFGNYVKQQSFVVELTAERTVRRCERNKE